MVKWPGVLDRGSAMGHDYQGTLATKEVDKELEECVYGEGLH